jgi:hypothetical protein
MLTDIDKERIREEESFRIEVRKLLAPPEKESKGGGGSWKFLNSPFALWLLSSVLITGGTAFVTWYLNNRSLERERAQNVRKLTIEAGYRIERLESFLKLLSEDYGTNPNPDAVHKVVGEQQMNGFREGLLLVDKQGVFKELSDRPLLSLIWELQSLVDVNKKADVDAAFRGAKTLQDLRWRWDEENEVPKPEFLKMLERLDKEVLTGLRRLPG